MTKTHTILFFASATVLCLALLAGTLSDAELDYQFEQQYNYMVCAGKWGDYHNLKPTCE